MKDTIYREDAIKALDNAWINGTSLLDANEAVKQLKDLPSAERPQGEWKPFDLKWGRSIWYCTACEEGVEVPCDICTHKPIYNFCPNCGAKMKGADDE